MNPNIVGLIAVAIVILAIVLGILGYMTAAWVLIAANVVLLIISRLKQK